MSLIRWAPMVDPFEDFDEMFNRLPALSNINQMQKNFVPATDVYETKEAVIVETALAGVKPEDVDITVENGVLTVQGQMKKEHEIEEKNYYRKEVRSGSFYRQVALPTAVVEDKVNAEFKDGILKIMCPKAEEVKAKKVQIKISK